MTLHLHIDSLSLAGVKIPKNQRPQLQAALETELARLCAVHGIPESWQQGGRIRKLPTNLTLAGTPNPTELGQMIARSVYAGLNPKGQTDGLPAAANASAANSPDSRASSTDSHPEPVS